ncbi:MAG TPA: alpha/beta hydrolase [Candidatus Acidoferrales bacterium]|jgi:acetyl esterase/lipase|nr:alpha/beta hydrolase [Candidatus Acidoferrales bacterium]
MSPVITLVLLSGALAAQTPLRMPKADLLWPNGAPGSQGNEEIDQPSIAPYIVPAGRGTGTAVVVCPGGGYSHLAMDHEGDQVAKWLNSLGVSAFVLKYRLGPKYHHPVELGDAQRAIRTVRAKAAEYRVAPDRIGIMGFSAGGHLASTAGTHFDAGEASAADPIDRMSSRPDFLVLGYPVISFTTPYTHKGSLQSLLGNNPDPKLVESLSNELQVTAQTPPTFLFHTTADTTVPVENSVLFYLALRKAGVPAEMHIYERGPHGLGLAPLDEALSSWPSRLAAWLRVHGLLNGAR